MKSFAILSVLGLAVVALGIIMYHAVSTPPQFSPSPVPFASPNPDGSYPAAGVSGPTNYFRPSATNK
jgi:hypothetical protein